MSRSRPGWSSARARAWWAPLAALVLAVVTITAASAGTAAAAGATPGRGAPRAAPRAVAAPAAGPTTDLGNLASFVPVAPQRLLDTRPDRLVGYAGGKPAAGATVTLPVAGVAGVPADARAVVLNVTGTEAAGGFVTVWPCGVPLPTASSLNLQAGVTAANLVITGLGAGGAVCFYTSAGTHLVADLTGWYPAGATVVTPTPTRVLDTRADRLVGYAGAKPAAGTTLAVQVTGLAGVPAEAKAVALNVTGTQAEGGGFVTVWPCGQPRPTASALNLADASARANLVVTGVGPGGSVCLYTSVAAHLVADLTAWFPQGEPLAAPTPTRVLDTRPDRLVGYSGPKPGPGATETVSVTGVTGVPADAVAVLVNVTGTQATGNGFVTVWPCGTPRPATSSLNLVAGGTRPNLAITGLGTGGTVCLYTSAGTHLVADVTGYVPSLTATAPCPAGTACFGVGLDPLPAGYTYAGDLYEAIGYVNNRRPTESEVRIVLRAGATWTVPTDGVTLFQHQPGQRILIYPQGFEPGTGRLAVHGQAWSRPANCPTTATFLAQPATPDIPPTPYLLYYLPDIPAGESYTGFEMYCTTARGFNRGVVILEPGGVLTAGVSTWGSGMRIAGNVWDRIGNQNDTYVTDPSRTSGDVGYGLLFAKGILDSDISGNVFSHAINQAVGTLTDAHAKEILHAIYVRDASSRNYMRGNTADVVSGDPFRLTYQSNDNEFSDNVTHDSAGAKGAGVSYWDPNGATVATGSGNRSLRNTFGYLYRSTTVWQSTLPRTFSTVELGTSAFSVTGPNTNAP